MTYYLSENELKYLTDFCLVGRFLGLSEVPLEPKMLKIKKTLTMKKTKRLRLLNITFSFNSKVVEGIIS